MKFTVSLTARVGASGTPSCSRTGSGASVAEAFDAAGAMVMKFWKGHEVPNEQVVNVTAGNKHSGLGIVEASEPSLGQAIASARRSLLDPKQGRT